MNKICKSKDTTVEKREKMRGGDGTVTIKHFFKKEDFKSKVRLCAKLILPPGTSIGLHEHPSEDEVYIILKGTGILTTPDGNFNVLPEDAILTGAGGSHSIKNNGLTDLEILAFITCYE